MTGGPGTARNPDDCERHRGRELAWNGRVNEREPLINVVRTSKPNDADRLEPKGMWPGVSDSLIPYRRQHDHRRTGGT